jgi:hypothetical protein
LIFNSIVVFSCCMCICAIVREELNILLLEFD